MKKLTVVLFIFILMGNLAAQNRDNIYTFFSAGHTYGSPLSPQYGLHPPFVAYIPEINNYPNMQLGFLTGDVVVTPTAAYWDSAQIDMAKIDFPLHIAAGNHDMGFEFLDRFEHYYYSFTHQNDLFIILTPGLDAWNISGDQLDFLTNALDSGENADNIFIFLHQLIWWAPDNFYGDIEINYTPQYPGTTNFDQVIKPLLLSCPNKITVYAGDLGASAGVSPFMFHAYDNITLIASGMGGGVEDNIIITEVYEDSVYFNLVALNGNDPKALGEITDYALSIDSEELLNWKLRVYPNPSSGYFKIENRFPNDLELSIYNIYGQLITEDLILNNSNMEIRTSNMKTGMYVIILTNKDTFIERKLIVQ